MIYMSALDVVNSLIKAYYTDRDTDKALNCVTNDIYYIGTDYRSIATNIYELENLLISDVKAIQGQIYIVIDSIQEHPINENCKTIIVMGKIQADDETDDYAETIATLCCVNGSEGWKVSSIHLSRITGNMYLQNAHNNSELQKALISAKKANQSKTEFLSRVSHDMRTPMNGILGIIELSEDENDVESLKKSIEKIKLSGEYLLGLINDTLDFQKIESGRMLLEPEIVLTRDVIDNVLTMVKPTASQKEIEFRMCTKDVDMDTYVKIDPMRMKQIFVNLISNAIKFTPSGGTVELRVESIGTDNNVMHYIITITDTGIGMSQEYLRNGIFRPFSQERNEATSCYAGSGLGLSIVKKLVELMQGTIAVESELGVGTKFVICVDFELAGEDEIQAENMGKNEKHIDYINILGGKSILIAEDHPLNAEIATRLLEKTGCNVKWVRNGQECIDEYRSGNTYDAILMDIRMPIMGGLEAAKRIRCMSDRTDSKTIPIIAMTANAYEDEIKESYAAGMNGHLTKPMKPLVLYETISKELI